MLCFMIASMAIYVSAEITSEEHFVRRIAVKIRENYQDTTLSTLTKYDYQLLYQITPQTYILEYLGSGTSSDLDILLKRLKNQYFHQILDIERVHVYENTLRPVGRTQNHMNGTGYEILDVDRVNVYEETLRRDSETQNLNVTKHQDCLECGNYYGMGVPEVWSLGYTGKGVIVAVTDVGIHTNLLDLRNNINLDLCYNFINDSTNITPEYFHNLQKEASQFSSHGDNCASLIVAEYGNGICASGIAYNAKAVGLKIFTIKLYKETFLELKPSFTIGSDIIARALVHNIAKIDIFSNAWATTKPFSPITMVMEDAIEYGAETGRHGLGTIYVVPAGPAGSGLANNIHTITINGVGRYGTIPQDSFLSASVITSGLSEGSNISAKFMYTTTRRKCVTNFKGVSPATAQVAAIIALALEGNPKLALRDIQDLLIQASEPFGSSNANGFIKNARGRFFHEVFGYGLINAEKLITLAKSRNTINSPVLIRRAKKLRASEEGHDSSFVAFCYKCDESNQCLSIVEHVMIKMKIPETVGLLRVVLESPSGTQSVLLHFWLSDELQLKDVGYQKFTSVHFWNETAVGKWQLKLNGSQGNDLEAELTLFGSEMDMYNSNKNSCENATSRSDQSENSQKAVINNSASTSTEISSTPVDDEIVIFAFDILITWFVVTAFVAILDPAKFDKNNQRMKKTKTA